MLGTTSHSQEAGGGTLPGAGEVQERGDGGRRGSFCWTQTLDGLQASWLYSGPASTRWGQWASRFLLFRPASACGRGRAASAGRRDAATQPAATRAQTLGLHGLGFNAYVSQSLMRPHSKRPYQLSIFPQKIFVKITVLTIFIRNAECPFTNKGTKNGLWLKNFLSMV